MEEQKFYRERLEERFGLDVVIPEPADRAEVHRIIYEELCRGKVLKTSRVAYLTAIERLRRAGAQAVILGCTEIGLLVDEWMTAAPLYDTTVLHARAAVDWMLAAD